MPTSVATLLSSCRKQIFLACTTLLALTLLPATGALGAETLPRLQRSEQVDVRRIGKVSEDERAVLRIEWRVGLNGVEETHRLQEIMDKLRRMESSMAAVSSLVRNMPVQKRGVEAVAPAEESYSPDWRLMGANIAALALVAIWWFGRRKSRRAVAAMAATGKAAETARLEPGVPNEARSTSAPVAKAAIAVVPTVEPSPMPSLADVMEPAAGTIDTAAQAPAAPAAVPPAVSSAPSAEPSQTMQPAPVEDPAPQIVDFSLEEATDPEPEPAPIARISPPPPATSPPPAAPEKTVEPTLQLAEIMLSMGLEQGAAQALIEYTEANPRHALHHWLKLLGIYRKRGLHQEFMAAAEKLRKNFNIQAEYLVKPRKGAMPTLEEFTRVAEHVQKIWGRPEECIDYLRRLLEDNRGGERAGFPQSVAEEMLLLVDILKEGSGAPQTTGA